MRPWENNPVLPATVKAEVKEGKNMTDLALLHPHHGDGTDLGLGHPTGQGHLEIEGQLICFVIC